jgi:hypothetical protein
MCETRATSGTRPIRPGKFSQNSLEIMETVLQATLPPSAYRTVTLDRPGPHNRPRVCEADDVKITKYPGTVRQMIVTGLGRDAPTVIITNFTDRG